ncbi:MAG: hypothetical protein LBK25_06245 [Treponema sp.]|nr:hypothetical protein [Treponema sp.]
MIFDKAGKVYSKIEFSNEDEIEKVVFNNFKLLFGDYSILLDKSLIATNSGEKTIPDGIIINFQESIWYILEVERGIHGTWNHIAPQISKQITAMENMDTRIKIAENCIKKINRNPSFKDLLNEINIEEINIHGTINKILQQQPKVALPIDFIPNDLKDWTKTLKVEVIVWLVEKYKDINGDILFSIPEKEIEDGIESDDNYGTKLKGNYLAQVIEKGLLSVGQELFFEYGTKDKNKTKFTGIVRKNGIEVDGEISSASISSLRCIQKINPTRTTSNGWTVWRTKDGKLIFELYKKLIELKQS